MLMYSHCTHTDVGVILEVQYKGIGLYLVAHEYLDVLRRSQTYFYSVKELFVKFKFNPTENIVREECGIDK